MRSERPAPRMSRARKRRAGCCCQLSTEDAGISGGTLERPGLQRLLDDIDAGLVDRIVVYKVDRLTRSLSDFAKLVDRLDAASTGFVSVTQSCAKTRPSRHRRKNRASRNQTQTLAPRTGSAAAANI